MIRLLFRVTGKDGASTLHSAEVHGSKSALLLDTPNVEIIGFEDCREINPRISIGYAEQIALAKQNCTLKEIIAKNKLWVPQNVGLNPEGKLVADAIKGQQIPSSEDIGLGGTAMDYRDLYEQREVLPGVFEARGKPTINADGVPWIHRQGTKPDLSQVSLDALKDEIALRDLVKKREENPPDKPVFEISDDGGFVIPPEIAQQIEAEFQPAGPAGFISVDDPGAQEPPNPESVAEYFRETLASRRKKAEEED